MARTYLEDRVERLESVVEQALQLTHTLYAMLIASLPEHKRELKDVQRKVKSNLRLIRKVKLPTDVAGAMRFVIDALGALTLGATPFI